MHSKLCRTCVPQAAVAGVRFTYFETIPTNQEEEKVRIEIDRNANRGLVQRAILFFVRKYIGIVPGPMLFLSFDDTQIPKSLRSHITRSVSQNGLFSKCERELFATFVSRLNSCNF